MLQSGRRRRYRGNGARPRPGWRRPPISHNFLHRASVAVAAHLHAPRPVPWWGLRLLLDDHVPSTGKPRQRGRRDDGSTSIALVLGCLLARMDLRSMRVGHPAGRHKRHDFVGLPRATIASWCGLDESTVGDVLSLLRRAGLVHGPARDHQDPHRIAQPYDGETDQWLPAVRRIDVLLFVGMGGRWGQELHRLRTTPAVRPPSAEQANAGRAARYAVDGIISRMGRPPDG